MEGVEVAQTKVHEQGVHDHEQKRAEFDVDVMKRTCEEFAAIAEGVPRCEQYSSAVGEMCDRIAARLDEFTMFLDGMRDDEEAIRAALPLIRAKQAELEAAFAAIDAMDVFTRNMKETVMTLEARAAAMEDFFSTIKMKGVLRIVPFFSKKANAPDPDLPEWRPIKVPECATAVQLAQASTLFQKNKQQK